MFFYSYTMDEHVKLNNLYAKAIHGSNIIDDKFNAIEDIEFANNPYSTHWVFKDLPDPNGYVSSTRNVSRNLKEACYNTYCIVIVFNLTHF